MKTKETAKQRRRRYRLHHLIRGHGYKVNARRKTVSVPHIRQDSVRTGKEAKICDELMSLGYSFQTHI